MEHRTPTIFEVAEQAARREARKPRPEEGARKLKPARKASARTAKPEKPKRKQAKKR